MSFEFTTVGEFATIQGGYAFKSHDFIIDSDFPVLKIKNIRNGFVDYGDTSFISAKIADGAKKWLTNEGDILISMTGSGPNAPDSLVGRVARVWRGDNPAFINQRVGRIVLKEPNRIDPDFIYYVLSQKDTQEFLVLNSTGSANQVNINSKTVESVPCPDIDYETSKSIAKVLRSLDTRIRLLGETNTTLESIAQALFKSWFVDFDPVHANAGTQAPSLPLEIQSLFPSTFVESSLGLVPEGWGVGKVEDVMELAYGKALKASDRVHGDVPVYGSGGITGCHSEALVNGPSIIVGRKGTVGTLYWEDRDFFPIDTVFYVKPKVSLCFCYYLLKSLPLADMNTDAAVPGLNRNNVYRLEVVIPPKKILMDFDHTVSLLRASIFSNDQKIQHLSALRDTLLPRLISGQLRLPEVEEHIQEIA